MKFKIKKRKPIYWILRFLFLALYIASVTTLIVEAATPGKQSASHSSVVGTTIGGIINDINGDQAKEILPTGVKITNSELSFSVGDTTTINVNTIPSDATYQSYTYSSSDEEIGVVDDYGIVEFLKEGSVTITATNNHVTTLSDSVTFTVSNVELVEFSSSILEAEMKDDVYLLEVNNAYLISNVINPPNTTFKQVSYEYEANGFFEMVDDTIKTLVDSGDTILTITTKCQEMSSVLNFKIFTPEVDYPLESIKVSNITRYTDQTSAFIPTITYVPSYVSAHYKGFTLQSDNESVVSVQSNSKSLKTGTTTGSANIIATSTYNPEITCTFNVTVAVRPALSSFRVTDYTSPMYIGNVKKMTVTPSPAGVSVTRTFTSSNPDAVSVSSDGTISALNIGEAIITIKLKDSYGNEQSKNITIVVVDKPPETITDFTIKYLKGDHPIIYADEESNLYDYFDIDEFIGCSVTSTNRDFEISVDTDVYRGSFDNGKFTPRMIGDVKGYLIYTNIDTTKIYSEFTISVIDHFHVQIDGEDVVNPITTYPYSKTDLKIVDQGEYGQTYRVEPDTPDTLSTALFSRDILVTAKKVGAGVISVYPVVKSSSEEEIERDMRPFSISVDFNIQDTYTTSLNVVLKNKKGDVVDDESKVFTIFLDDEISVNCFMDSRTTRSEISMSMNNTVAEVKNGVVTPLRIGDTILTIKEEFSNLSRSFKISIRNRVVISEEGAIILSGEALYVEETNTVQITNGDTVKIRVNFAPESTYKIARYTIKNTKVCTIGKDGTITPLKVGKTILTITVKDSLTDHTSMTINIKVVKKNAIQNMQEFLAKIRKLVGHFGAFAVLGIVSTIAYFLWFRRKLFPVGVALNFGLGFALASLTEEIQKHVPGRAGLWSDVILDMSGFLLTALTITGIIILIFGIIYFVKWRKSKKNKMKVEESIDTPQENDSNEEK